MANLVKKLVQKSTNQKRFEEALAFAKESYKNVTWLSGENYMDHAVRTALILQDMGIDEETTIATLLYNALNIKDQARQKTVMKQIEEKFGKDAASLAEKSFELNKIYYSIALDVKEKKSIKEEKIENIKKMFFAIAGDLRVVLMKLAARIDGMHHLRQFPQAMQKIYATETLVLFASIANRLGLGEIKTQLEDDAFAFLHQDQFAWLVEKMKEKYEKRQQYLKKFIPHLKKILKHEKIQFVDINYRVKSYWSLYQKLQKYYMDFERIHDLVALRVIVNDVSSCYKALGAIHKYYKPITPKEFNDYIVKPKPNGYQSLHTNVLLKEQVISEIQIKTQAMHKEAQYGVCAHWAYKEKKNIQAKDWFGWTREIPEFWKNVKIDFFENQVFTFTPRGDVIVLPKESTAIDFAYAIHSEIGNHCEYAKIQGKIIPLSQALNNGDVVEIIIDKKRVPSQDWLKFVKTNLAKSHIKKATLFKIPSAIFSIPFFIKNKIFEISEKQKKKKEEKIKIKKEKPSQIYLAGQKGIMVTMAKCCNPKTGDVVKAYITKQRAAVLHKASCKNLQKIETKFPEKIIDSSWN